MSNRADPSGSARHGPAGLYIGLISGTSVDGIDCALIETGPEGTQLLATQALEYSPALRSKILAICHDGQVSLSDLGDTDVAIGKAFAAAANALMRQEGLTAGQIVAIGSHGQTIYHQPQGTHTFSLQLGDPNTIAALTGVTTVADFRQRDMAMGGQGAPLAPLFHQHFFHSPGQHTLVLNIGGMANITVVDMNPAACPTGFDTGPGNVLMDLWIEQYCGKPYDADGAWAASGQVLPALLSVLMAEPYFSLPAPKSTGRELFNARWLGSAMQQALQLEGVASYAPEDVQRTLLQLTALSIAEAVAGCVDQSTDAGIIAVCGGGAHNRSLMSQLQTELPTYQVVSSDHLGMPADWVEAATFAWLASNTIGGIALDCSKLTGSRSPVILGGIYQSER
ncbi:anhydro-N-acetylmuramic acid kinase [Pseudohongiella sp. SYSU M77423]|uniref:anhydro-N-acetylmuramic acid kinase n=1 Tax=Pseudohongiella sp. SYSU M77423 TaxID=3042312 RepID=UPI000C657E94|nr:anhydro-N-acetylmuramic acid kinase [Pseudohongiella sp. SYSU M77423]MAY55732.1 anhydro-N-acetylmuramic acid kinase [Gammaproteobacteria bacterium]MBJ54041.1 anhydro-N-acetylmuramic acid kinase [Gammaproteobacteria bacterium]MDH7944080.1 anhydro-N-acetylmuramic acid kinase [Pseudohongiella sp. SYSU M77423]MEC8861190.1 anhydro-N-acetylmuramic acid kinase [Pseudomonadota bacterium]